METAVFSDLDLTSPPQRGDVGNVRPLHYLPPTFGELDPEVPVGIFSTE